MSNVEEHVRKRTKSGQERQSEWKKNNPNLVKLSKEKSKLETLKRKVEDENFADEVKRKERERKAAYRAKKVSEEKENVENETAPKTSPTSGPNPKSRQSLSGLLVRRRSNYEKYEAMSNLVENNKELQHENEKMDVSMQEAEVKNMNLKIENKKKDSEIAALKSKLVENDQWLKSTYKYMTSSGKREFKTAHKLASHEHPKGTDYRLRQNTGINLSNKLTVTSEEKSELKKKIEQFAEEHSSESPDMKNEKKGIRYRHKYLAVLYDDFKHENPDFEVSIQSFCNY